MTEKPPSVSLNVSSTVSCNAVPVLVIAGPTASGKSALAVDAAERFGGVVINADSMQVYSELDVLTARPQAADLARAEHRLFGVLPAAERCSVGRWLELAAREIVEVRAAGQLPIVVGGTGMYLKALMEGLAPVPEIPEAVTLSAQERYDEIGGEAFRGELAILDPDAAAALPAGDRQRLIRAFAVAQATGRTLKAWQRATPQAPAVPGPFVVQAIIPPRDELYAACDRRLEAMMAAGALAEVRDLLSLGLDTALPAMRALGVPELTAHITGECPLDDAVEKAQQHTRNFAKRQLTWLRHQLTADLTLEARYETDAHDTALSALGKRLRSSGFIAE